VLLKTMFLMVRDINKAIVINLMGNLKKEEEDKVN